MALSRSRSCSADHTAVVSGKLETSKTAIAGKRVATVIRQIVISVIAVVLVWVCIDLVAFRRRNVNARTSGSDLLAFTFIVLLTGAFVFIAVGSWLTGW